MELQSQERAHRQRLRDLSADEDAEIEKQRSQLGNQVSNKLSFLVVSFDFVSDLTLLLFFLIKSPISSATLFFLSNQIIGLSNL